jgi:hypothetical protein
VLIVFWKLSQIQSRDCVSVEDQFFSVCSHFVVGMAIRARCGLSYEDSIEACKANDFVCPVFCTDGSGNICGQLLIKHPGAKTYVKRGPRKAFLPKKKYVFRHRQQTSPRFVLEESKPSLVGSEREEFISWTAAISAPHSRRIKNILVQKSYQSKSQLILYHLWKYLNENHSSVLLKFDLKSNLSFTEIYNNPNDLDLRARPWNWKKLKKRLPQGNSLLMQSFDHNDDLVWGHFKKFLYAHETNLSRLMELSEGSAFYSPPPHPPTLLPS